MDTGNARFKESIASTNGALRTHTVVLRVPLGSSRDSRKRASWLDRGHSQIGEDVDEDFSHQGLCADTAELLCRSLGPDHTVHWDLNIVGMVTSMPVEIHVPALFAGPNRAKQAPFLVCSWPLIKVQAFNDASHMV